MDPDSRTQAAGRRVRVIAEAGVNHNGSLEQALLMVDAAARAGADTVKFQTFRADALVRPNAPKAEYQAQRTGRSESQLEMLRRLELTPVAHRRLVAHCVARGIRFMSTPFDVESLRMLVGELRVAELKIPSGEITNGPLLLEAARTGLPILLSTGMATLEEVQTALGVLAFGYIGSSAHPSRAAFGEAYRSSHGRTCLEEQVVLLHCTSAYPAPPDTVNLRAMDSLRDAFGLQVGLSDHTTGIVVALAAAARGACVIEKHFTLDRTSPGPDQHASVEPNELSALVTGIREIERALGRQRKGPEAVELPNRTIARKSLVAARPIGRGERFDSENLTAKRPADGCSPMDYWDLLGRPASRDYDADAPIDEPGFGAAP